LVFRRRGERKRNHFIEWMKDGVAWRACENVWERGVVGFSCAEQGDWEDVFLEEVADEFEVGVDLQRKG
jgi:hypothetical protein